MTREVTMSPFVLEQNWKVATAWIHAKEVEPFVAYWSYVVVYPHPTSEPGGVRDVLGYTRDYLTRIHPGWYKEIRDCITDAMVWG